MRMMSRFVSASLVTFGMEATLFAKEPIVAAVEIDKNTSTENLVPVDATIFEHLDTLKDSLTFMHDQLPEGSPQRAIYKDMLLKILTAPISESLGNTLVSFFGIGRSIEGNLFPASRFDVDAQGFVFGISSNHVSLNSGKKHHQLSLALALGGGGALTIKKLIFGKKMGQGERDASIGETEESSRKSQANLAFIYGINDADPSSLDRSLDSFIGFYAGGGGKIGLMGNDRYDRASGLQIGEYKNLYPFNRSSRSITLVNTSKTGGLDIQGEGFVFLPFFGLDVDFANAWNSLIGRRDKGVIESLSPSGHTILNGFGSPLGRAEDQIEQLIDTVDRFYKENPDSKAAEEFIVQILKAATQNGELPFYTERKFQQLLRDLRDDMEERGDFSSAEAVKEVQTSVSEAEESEATQQK